MHNRILVNGSTGHMGQVTIKAIQEDETLELVGENHGTDDIKKAIERSNPDIVVDFTNAQVVFANIKAIIETQVHPVIGTSGLLPEQVKELQQICTEKKLGGIIVPNFCIAALLMMRFAEQAARYYPEVEIIEIHHEKKQDAPSGTAIKTADLIAQARKKDPSIKKLHEVLPGSRGACQSRIPIHSLRLPGFLAKQAVIFGHLGGNLIISQETIDRTAFMPGIRLACKKVAHLKGLIYGLETLL